MTAGGERKGLTLRQPATISRALTLTVFIALLPLLIASFLQASASWRDTLTLADQQLASTARAIAERARDPFAIAAHSLKTVAAMPAVRAMSAGCNEGLAAGRTDDPMFVNFVRSDAKGMVRCSVVPFDTNTDLSVNRWWQEGIVKPGFSLSPPYFGQVSKRQMFIVMLPVSTPEGIQDGAVTAGLELSVLRDLVLADPAARSGYVAVLDRDGKALFESQSQGFDKLPADSLADQQSVKASNGREWSYALAPIYTGDLILMYAEPRQEIMSVALANIRYSVLFPLLAILFASGAIWLGSDIFVLRWLRKLQDLSGRFARGDYRGDRLAFAGAPREVKESSEQLHDMAHAIVARDHQLTAALDAQTKLTREIHHRVKNNLQIVTSLLTLQAGRLKEEAARNALAQTRARVSALGLIYRLLYEQGPNSEAGHVPLDTLVGELCAQMRSAHHARPDIQLECKAEQQSISIDQAVPLALFMVEGVTNAYRHAFPDGRRGTIRLTLQSTADGAILSVEDDGAGYDSAATAPQMGSDLMSAFAGQLGGQFATAPRDGGGTIVSITFRPDNA